MKKSILLICLISLINTANAQFSLGIKGGVSTSKVITDAGSFKANISESLGNRTGFVFGAYATIGKKLYFQPEVLFASKGGKVDITPTLGGSPVSVNIKTNNLDVPLLIGYKFFGKIKVHAGPVASIKINEDEKFVTELRKVTGDVDAAFQKATFGYQAGIGIKLLGFNFDLRKDGSLSDISATKFGDSNTFDQRITGWQITIGKNIL
jgi:Outer membrane protein beta-barrel domain